MHVVRNNEKEIPYDLLITTESSKFEYNLGDFVSEEFLEEEKKIRLVFKDDYHFEIGFRYMYDFLSVKRFLITKRQSEVEGGFQIFGDDVSDRDGESVVHVHNDIIRNYSNGEKISEGKTPIFLGSGVRSANSVAGGARNLYYDNIQKKCEEWRCGELMVWFQQIPVLDKENKKIISLHTFLTRKNLLHVLVDYFGVTNGPFIVLRNEVNKDEPERAKEVKGNFALESLLEYPVIVSRLRTHFKILSFMKENYNPSYYVLLRKRIMMMEKQLEQRGFGFEMIVQYFHVAEERCLFNLIYSWSAKALRLRIAFSLLFGVSVEEYQEVLECLFKESKMQQEDLTDIQALEKFNNEVCGFKLENLSVEVNLAKKYWLLTSEVKKYRSMEKDLAKQEKSEVLEFKKQMAEKIEPKLESLAAAKSKVEKNDPQYEMKMKILEKTEKRFRSIVKGKAKKVSEVQVAFRKVSDQRKELEEKKKEMMLNFREKEREMKWKFYNIYDGAYFRTIQKLVDIKIKSLLGDDEVVKGKAISIPIKFLVARHVSTKIDWITKISLKLFKVFAEDNDSSKVGFTHSGVIIGNVSLHFFGNSLVLCEDIKGLGRAMERYEDLACMDTQNQVFLNRTMLENFTRKVSCAIIDTNTNYIFNQFGVRALQKSYIQNCQEFSISIMRKLGLPFTFYPEIHAFIDSLSTLEGKDLEIEEEGESDEEEKMNSLRKRKEKCYKYIPIPETFPKPVKDLCEDKEELRKYFPTHRELDLFALLVHQHVPNFQMEYPGMYQLLKSFDHAFWCMKLRLDMPSPTNEPLMREEECACPFLKKFDLEDIDEQQQDEGEVLD